MQRPASHRIVLGSVSAIAMAAMLSACTQPASYATVDLGGSYGSTVAQAYSPLSGQPVYQSTSLYGPQSFPDAPVYQSTTQLAALDAPVNQVASLGYGRGFDTYGITEAPAPQYSPLAQSAPIFEEAELLATPEFAQEVQALDQGFVNMGPLDAPTPFAAPAPAAPEPLQTLDVAPAELPSFDTAYAVNPNLPKALPPAPRRSVIEEAPLAELTAPEAAPRLPNLPVADDYATLGSDVEPAPQPRAAAPDIDLPAGPAPYKPWIPPQFGSVETPETAARAPIRRVPLAQAPAQPAPRAQTESRGPDADFTEAARDLLPPRPQQTRMPAPIRMPDQLQLGGGLRVPKASTEYPRPYEALRPGIWPELEGVGEGMVQAPPLTSQPQLAAADAPTVRAPVEDIASASERMGGTYTIQRGDSLLTIAQRIGMSPERLAFDNGLTPEAQIYIGQTIMVPAMEPRAESATPMQPASIEVTQTTSVASARFAWPVHGEVYRLDAGQVEIDANGNAPVTASASGRVVHVERGPMGVLVVIEHDNGWRSLTVGLDSASVHTDQIIDQGASIGIASREHRVRFELRDTSRSVADVLANLRG